ncbi:MAG: sulfatase-like hydrolase/transferase [Deltaproteobacteria bacterium]|nr:sulfatase-like hydrolase/transferase [Deltaproteobacteria bacterium]
MNSSFFRITATCTLTLFSSIFIFGQAAAEPNHAKRPPNILFLVMDDVGIDQMKIFGYGGANPPKTPNIDTVALAGVRFRNTWAHPTCSASRASFFDGRYSIRTNVLTAITSDDLANSQVSPYEYTTPKILKKKGYVSGLFGKMHLTGSQVNTSTNPFGNEVYRKLGWDHFEGFLDGGPYPIDTTAGGIGGPSGNSNTYGCGYIPSTASNATIGADTGACYTDGGATCEVLATPTFAEPGKTCLERGGILDPNQTCQSPSPSYLDFDTQNAYYTGSWVINEEDGTTTTLPPADPRGRSYRTVQEADRTIAWVNQQKAARKPWMASLGFSAIHDPVQAPPAHLIPDGSIDTNGFNCDTEAENRAITTQMVEAIDHEIGRVLVETGLASYNDDGSLDYHPEKTNTVVVIIGDNGTWTTSVRAPFDPTRAKGTPYQTGVWVPLVVAGPMVKNPGRQVSYMTNALDLFDLFGEVAGIDVRRAVPKSHVLDSRPLMPYLKNPKQSAIRKSNFTMQGNNLVATTTVQSPCYIASINTCTLILPTQGVCEDQGGQWFGAGGVVSPDSYSSCCQVNDYLATLNEPAATYYIAQRAIRNRNYKLVQNELENCSAGGSTFTTEFYRISDDRVAPKVDFAAENLLKSGAPALTKAQLTNYNALVKELQALEKTVVSCPGDGNLDKVVDQKDLKGWKKFSATSGVTTPNGGGQSSWFDFDLDGLTGESDKQIILDNFGKRCK